MADQPGQEAKGTGQETIFNSGIGDDWGEAFEAEDFLTSQPAETSTEFFLPEEPAEVTVKIPTEAAAVSPLSSPSPAAGKLGALATRFRALPLAVRLAPLAVILIGAVALVLTLRKSPHPPALKPEAPPQATVSETPPVEPVPAEPQPRHEEAPPPPQAPPTAEAVVAEPVLAAAKKLRKKWHFPAIIVQAKTEKDRDTAILSTDLTLTLALAPEAMPPADKDPFIREILYQFYTNQPLDDLQRFALERGEMNRKLQAWIMKQWPDLPLESITVDRYQLL